MPKINSEAAESKRQNRQKVLDLIRTASPISRTDLSERTGLNKATVSTIVHELIQWGVVTEIGQAASSVGRKPILLAFRPDCALILGVVLNVGSVDVALTNLAGQIVWKTKQTLENRPPEAVCAQMAAILESAMQRAARSAKPVAAIGIGVPGLVDFESGVILHTPNMQLNSINLKQFLETRYRIPVFIDNSANVSAVGELLFGLGRQFRHFVYVSVSTGIGAGIIMHGELQRGSRGFAGEVGHMNVVAQGLACSCGANGCWEMYASLKALHRAASVHLPEIATAAAPDFLPDVLTAADNGARWAVESLQAVGNYLGLGIANIVQLFNPEAVMIGNEMARAETWIRPLVESALETRCGAELLKNLTLEFEQSSLQKTLVGAASIGIHGFLTRLVRS